MDIKARKSVIQAFMEYAEKYKLCISAWELIVVCDMKSIWMEYPAMF